MLDYNSRDTPYGSDEQHVVGKSSDIVDTLRRLKVGIRIFKEDNDKIILVQEKQA